MIFNVKSRSLHSGGVMFQRISSTDSVDRLLSPSISPRLTVAVGWSDQLPSYGAKSRCTMAKPILRVKFQLPYEKILNKSAVFSQATEFEPRFPLLPIHLATVSIFHQWGVLWRRLWLQHCSSSWRHRTRHLHLSASAAFGEKTESYSGRFRTIEAFYF